MRKNRKMREYARVYSLYQTDKERDRENYMRFHLSTLSDIFIVAQHTDLHFSESSFYSLIDYLIRIWV